MTPPPVSRCLLAAAFDLIHGRGVLFVFETYEHPPAAIIKTLRRRKPGYKSSDYTAAYNYARRMFDQSLKITEARTRPMRLAKRLILPRKASASDRQNSEMDVLVSYLSSLFPGFSPEQYRISIGNAQTQNLF